MSTLDEVIQKLSSFDLASIENEEVLRIVQEVQDLGMFGLHLAPDSYVIRVRPHPNADFGKEITSEEKLGYLRDKTKLPPLNRASFDGDVVFYGCTGLRHQLEESNMLAIHEVCNITKNPAMNEEYAVAGLWRVTKPINVVAVVHQKEFTDKNSALRELHESYVAAVGSVTEKAEASLRFAEFMAREFAKDVPSNRKHQYKISAAFGTHVRNLGLDGVAYPSAVAKGDTSVLNIALNPASVDAKMKLEQVTAFQLIRMDETTVAPSAIQRDWSVSGDFSWEPIPGSWTAEQVRAKWHEEKALGIEPILRNS